MDAWSIARHDLSLTSEEWLDLTPRHIQALRKRHLQQMQREELLVSMIASNVLNTGFRGPEKAVKMDHFMLHPFPPEPEEPITGEYLMSLFSRVRDPKTPIQGIELLERNG